MGFRKTNFLLLLFFGGGLVPYTLYAGTCQCGWPGNMCSTTQYCIEQQVWDPDAQMMDYDYYCDECPTGHGHSPNDCYTCEPLPRCDGYDDCPAGVGGSGKKCKEVSGCPNGCHKYEICDTTTGAITNEVTPTGTNGCHIERGTHCEYNTTPCSTFVIDHFFIGWNCDQGAQIGTAEWKTNKSAWDTKNCTCAVRDRNITAAEYGPVAADVKCQNANADFYVEESYRYGTTSIDGAVIYSVERLYCKQCYPGYLPFIVPSPNDGVDMRPASEPGDWGTSQCTIQVSAPYYADGCIVDWGASTGALAVNECKNSCPAGMILNVNGATGPDQCEVDPSQRFTDNTGMFIIGEGQCSTPGGGGG